MTAIKSQIATMSGVVVQAAPITSQLGQYVKADIKGGDFKLAFLQSLITIAVTEAFKNNGRGIAEAATLTTGKAKKARAYAAGFQAIGECKPVPYKGKYDSKDNADIREQINVAAQAACARFTEAFNVVMAEKAAPKAKAETPAAAPAAADAAPVMQLDGDVPESIELDQTDAVQQIADMLAGGMLASSDVLTIRAALAQFDLLQEQIVETEALAA